MDTKSFFIGVVIGAGLTIIGMIFEDWRLRP